MTIPNVSPIDQSSSPSYGPNHELFTGLSAQGQTIDSLKRQVTELQAISGKTDILCAAYKDLHTKRILFLLSVIPAFIISSIILLHFNGIEWGHYDWLIKLALGTSVVGLIFESIWFPNKIKEMDKALLAQRSDIESIKKDIESIKSKLSDVLRTPSETPAVKKLNGKSKPRS